MKADLTTADMVKVGREIMEGKGLCLTCHTIGKTGALRFPDLAGRRCPREDPRPGPERCRVLRPVDVRTQRLRRAGIQSGDAHHQQASDRPHRSGDPLRDRVPPDSWRHADGHAPDDAPLPRRAAATPAAAPAPAGSLRPRRPPATAASLAPEGRRTMKILVVLAVARRVRAPSLPPGQSADVGRRLVGGDLRPAPIRIHRPDSLLRRLDLHGNRLARDPGVRVLQPGAPRGSLPPARPVHDGEAVHRAPRRDGRRHPGARGRERLRPDERPPPASALLANGPSCIAFRDHGSRQEDRSRRRREPLPASRDVESGRSSAHMSRTGARSTIGTASSATATTWPATACSCTGWTRSRPTSRPSTIPHASRDVSVLADLQGRPRASRGRRVPGTRPCPPGRSS